MSILNFKDDKKESLIKSEKEFLKTYNSNDYPHPSVAVDVVLLRVNNDFKLQALLLKRAQYPYLGSWQLPGIFVPMTIELEDVARQSLIEKAGQIYVNHFEQLYTYGKVIRDPRTRVISIVYYGIEPQNQVDILKTDCRWIDVDSVNNLAFDHKDILVDALKRLQGKLSYCDLAFEFLNSKSRFTIYEVQKIWEAIMNKTYNAANFRRDFLNRYIKTDIIEQLDETSTQYSKRPSQLYSVK